MALEYIPGADPVPHDAPQAEVGGSLGLPNQPCSVCSGIANEVGLEVYKCSDGSGPYYYSNVTLNGGQVTSSIIGQNVRALPNQPCNTNQQIGPIWHVAAIFPADPNGIPFIHGNYDNCTDLEIYQGPCISFPPPPPPPPPPPAADECINPITNALYQIGDTGPGGGIIFLVPLQGNNSTNYYFEVAPVDVSTTQRAQAVSTPPGGPISNCLKVGNAIPGAEFGVYKENILPSNNGSSIGDGLDNTFHLNSYPISLFGPTAIQPTNPVLDIHDLAAKLCADYVGPNGHTDWFLPSLSEMMELASSLSPTSVFNNVANIANLSTSNSHPASAFYWTSSVPPSYISSTIDTIAGGINVVNGLPVLMDRCTTGSVRPVRMFECHLPITPPVEYNWRDGGGNLRGGLTSGGQPYPGFGNILGDSIIGTHELSLNLSVNDVLMNQYNPWELSDDSIGYIITMWAADETYLGKWRYNTCGGYGFFIPGGGPQCAPFGAPLIHLSLVGVTHLDGPNPIINYNSPNVLSNGGEYNSVSHAFIKIECVATEHRGGGAMPHSGGASSNAPNITPTASGGDQTWKGNPPLVGGGFAQVPGGCFPYPDITHSNYPCTFACCNQPTLVCGPASATVPQALSGHECTWTYQVVNSPTYGNNTFASHDDCMASNGNMMNFCCGGTSATGASTAKLAAPPENWIALNKIRESNIITHIDQLELLKTSLATENNVVIKSIYNNDENQTVKATYEDNLLFREEEDDVQKMSTINYSIISNSTKNIFNITFKTNEGYYYSKSPSLTMNFPGMENYKIKVESESKNTRGYVTEKTFNVNYKNTGFDVYEEDGHNIIFTTKIVKEVDKSTETQVKEITALRIGTIKNLKSKGNGNIKY